jgi:hypothetical protein
MPFKFRGVDLSNAEWTAIAGNWTEKDSVFCHSPEGVSPTSFCHYICNKEIRDGAIEATVRVFQGGDNSGRIVFRYSPSGCYYAGIGGWQRHFAIVKEIRGDFGISTMALAVDGFEKDIRYGQPYNLRVEFVGDKIILKNSGITVLSRTDSWLQEGHIGLDTFGQTHVEFSNVRAYEIPPLSRLVQVLESFPYTLKRDYSYRKTEMRDEKDVQRILWAILRSHYADLEDEEVLGKFGLKHYKSDFGIPSLSTIIEVKVIYKNTNLKKLQEELMTDAAGYFASVSKYRHLVSFIYNKANKQVDNAFVEALESIEPVAAVLIIPGVTL